MAEKQGHITVKGKKVNYLIVNYDDDDDNIKDWISSLRYFCTHTILDNDILAKQTFLYVRRLMKDLHAKDFQRMQQQMEKLVMSGNINNSQGALLMRSMVVGKNTYVVTFQSVKDLLSHASDPIKFDFYVQSLKTNTLESYLDDDISLRKHTYLTMEGDVYTFDEIMSMIQIRSMMYVMYESGGGNQRKEDDGNLLYSISQNNDTQCFNFEGFVRERKRQNQ